MYAALIIFCLILSMILFHNDYYRASMLNNKFKTAIIYIIYKKISSFTSFTIRTTDTGKLINILANDFNSIDNRLIYFLGGGIGMPFIYICSAVVLVKRLGWSGLICIVIPMLFFPVQGLLGKISGKYLESLNVFKDKRIKITN